MSELNDDQKPTAAAEAQESAANTTDEALRKNHAARTKSAAARTAATCDYLSAEQSSLVKKHEAGAAVKAPVLKAEHAVRTAAQAVGALSKSNDPSAHARCARNASAAAALAAQTAQLHDNASELASAAYRAALQASRAAGDAAAKGSTGRNITLNTKAVAAEAEAVAAAEKAGWMRAGHQYAQPASDEGFTPSLADVMHLEH